MYHSPKYRAFAVVFFALAAAAFLPGCKKDFLNRQPLGQYTTDNYPYPSGGGPYDQYIYAAYAAMRSYNASGFPFVGAVSIRSDDADKGSTPGDSPDQIAMDEFSSLTATNGLVDPLWTGYYANINAANLVLQQVGYDSLNKIDAATKIRAQAEAKFIRGYSYFTLVRLFGKVPIIDTVLTVSGANTPQSDVATVYAFIEKDLQFAAANLPITWPATFIGRATSGAANGILAKAYLYEQKWALAQSTALTVINSQVYNLNVPYSKIFTTEGQNSSESVFEIQNYADANHQTDYGCQYAEGQGVRGSGQFDFGWGFNVPSSTLDNAYEPGDPRKASTFLYCPSTSPTIYGELLPAEPNPIYNMKVYTDPAKRAAVGNLHAYWVNVRILRYADVVLIAAEAANELGDTTSAKNFVNQVRARARGGNNSILPDVVAVSQANMRSLIQQERRVELAMEHERFFDIVRWGIVAAAEQAAGKTGFVSNKNELLPIPQAEIDLSKGVLKQNPGYN